MKDVRQEPSLQQIKDGLTFQHQADATLNQANPVSGTKYTVLDTQTNVRLIGIEVECAWTVQPSPLEVHITIDGQALTFVRANPVTTLAYYVTIKAGWPVAAGDLSATDPFEKAFLLEGRSVKVEVEVTGGTVSSLKATVQWAKR